MKPGLIPAAALILGMKMLQHRWSGLAMKCSEWDKDMDKEKPGISCMCNILTTLPVSRGKWKKEVGRTGVGWEDGVCSPLWIGSVMDVGFAVPANPPGLLLSEF